MTPFDQKFIKAQTKEHSILSKNGHEWEVSESGQTRLCIKCMAIECSPPHWVPVPPTSFSLEEIKKAIENNL